jgi:hypothetical protein
MISWQKLSLLMLRVFLIFIPVFLFSQTINLYTKKIENSHNKIRSYEKTVLFFDRQELQIDAKNININSINHTIEAFGDTTIKKGKYIYLLCNYLYMDFKKNSALMDNFFYISLKEPFWMEANEAKKNNHIYELKGAVVSTCEPKSPDWSIRFNKGKYNSKDEWIDLYNPLFYAGRVPILYLPYFGFSTSTKRKSGFLSPSFGYSNIEGLLYKQPLYLAFYPQWDLTLYPEMREKRGEGIMAQFRFVDSPNSSGKIEMGKFTDYDSFTKKENIQKKEHEGFMLIYQKNKIFSKNNAKDKLYLNILNVSDVDYFSIHSKEPLQVVPSKLNYLYYTNKEYFGVNAKYFKDTTTSNNDKTLQLLPQFEYHLNSNTFYFDKLLYSLGYKFKNFERIKGSKAKEHSINFPLIYTFSFLNDYANIAISNNLYLYKISYSNIDNSQEDYGKIIKDSLYISAFTDLSKEYQNYFHNINIELGYSKLSIYKKDGYFDDEFTTLSQDKDIISLKFNEYFLKEGKRFLTHRATQAYYVNDESNLSMPDFENEIILNINSKIQKDIQNIVLTYKQSLNADEIIVAIMNSKNGEIYAICSSNRYNPKNISKNDIKNMKINAIQYLFEPGSIIKPFILSILLEDKKVSEFDVVKGYNGKYSIENKTITDTHPFSWISVEDVIVYSSNIGMAQLSQNLTAYRYKELFEIYGFNSISGVDLPYEKSGKILSIAKLKSPLIKATASYGYGFSVTFMQLLKAYNIFNNKGVAVTPKIARKIIDNSGKIIDITSTKKEVLSIPTANKIMRILRKTVLKGTAKKAFVDGVFTAGKTGTAHIAKNGVYEHIYHSSFFGFANDKRHKYTIGVLVINPKTKYFASQTAVPIFKKSVEVLIDRKWLQKAKIKE